MKTTLRSVALHQLLLSILVVPSSFAAEGQPFEVSGRMETISAFHDGIAGTTNSRTFTVAMNGWNGFIRCSAGTADQGVDYHEFGTDGTNGFHLGKTLLRAIPSSPRGLVNDATMHIEPSSLPPPSSGAITKIWLVYTAQREFNGRLDTFVRPLGYIWLRETPVDQELRTVLNDHLLLRADWTLDSQEPHLPKMYVDYRDGKLASDRYSQSLIPAEFMTGRTNSRLDVLSWTNVAGLHIPTHARLMTYIANMNNPGGPLQVHLTHHLIATNIAAGTTRREFVPKLSKATSVVDYRFGEDPRRPATYLATNGVIFHTAEEAWAEVRRQGEESLRRREEHE